MKKHAHIYGVLRPTVVVVALLGIMVGSPHAQSDRKARELYKQAQQLLNDERYADAASEFRSLAEKYEDSKYAADAMYWYAFSLYRMGGRTNLRNATAALEVQMSRAGGGTKDDASALYYRVLGELARQGDAEAASKLEETREELDAINHDLETKLMAMEALINMRPERALPVLKTVLENKSRETAQLREKAVFLLAQHDSKENVDLLMNAAKNDPDREVREHAIFWLSQVHTDTAIDFLEEVVTTSDDPAARKKAVYAISQHDSQRSSEILRRLAQDPGVDSEVREQAIFWLGQQGINSGNLEFFVQLYDRLDDEDLKEKLIFSVSQSSNPAANQWIVRIVNDKSQPVELRKHALWAGHERNFSVKDLLGFYDSDDEIEFREQVIFVLSQTSDPQAIDAMMDLARKEKNRDLRKKLIFWIGQSDDPRAADFLLDIINE